MRVSKKMCTFALHPLSRQRGVAQLVAFLVWDQAVAGSSPVTSTLQSKNRLVLLTVSSRFFIICVMCRLAEFARAVANDNIVDFRLMTKLLVEALLGIVNELKVEVVAYQVDGTSTKSTTHNT